MVDDTEFEFVEAPQHLMGWAGPEVAEPEFERLTEEFVPFELVGAGPEKPGPFVWEFAKKVNGGEHIANIRQQTGDCVSWGMANAGMYLSAYQIYRERSQELFRRWFAPWIYGTARVQVGGGYMRVAGATGSWAATAVKKYGVLFDEDLADVTYSGALADQWGNRPGPPSRYFDIAKDNLIRSAARLNSVEQIREALINYHMVTIASNQGFAMKPVVYRDHHVFKPAGTWRHQTAYLGWLDDPFAGAYRLNCYDDQTEILTDIGWKSFQSLSDSDRVATLDTKTHEMVFEFPSERQEYDYNGPMVLFKSQGVDLSVTPNHRMYVCQKETTRSVANGGYHYHDAKDPANWQIVTAEKCWKRVRIKKDARWKGESAATHFRIGSYDIPIGDWLEFLGFYVAEGHCSTANLHKLKRKAVATAWTAQRGIKSRKEWESAGRSYVIGISQKPGKKADRIQRILDRLPWRFTPTNTGWQCHSKELWYELASCGRHAHNKRLPNYFRNLARRPLCRLYKGLMLGDDTDCRSTSGQETYYTSSPGLAGDVQELLLRIGLAGDVYVTDRTGRVNAKGTTRYPEYQVGVKRTRLAPSLAEGFAKIYMPYRGKVYCVSTVNGIVYVRRNGIACWCGQSWGSTAHGTPLNGEPPGGAWNLADDMEYELKTNKVEIYAISLFDGFPAADLDFSIV